MGLAPIISGDLGVMRIYRTVDPFVEWGLLLLFSDENSVIKRVKRQTILLLTLVE